ncbi:MAG: peptide ABC transporter substrate-binding protein [Kouleothrix sp.]|nr:peptide ABC transporter substrate-binding protein [Kouleothrix sp.]
MRTRTSSSIALVVILAALLVAACGQTASAPPTAVSGQPTAAPAPSGKAPADTLRWPIEGLSELTSLDPAVTKDAPNNIVITLVFSGLVRLDDKLEVQPDGASEWKVSDDGTIYTFTLRDGLKFGDGTPVTAGDFVYSINRAVSPETGAFAASTHFGHILGVQDVIDGKTKTVAGVSAIDDKTLEIKLDAPIAYFLALLTYPDTFVVPQKLVESGAKWPEQAYGTGPYRVKEWKHGQSIELVANEHYWQGKPGIPNILMPFAKDSETAYQLYQTGELDIEGSGQNPVPAAHVADVQSLPDFKSAAQLTTRYVGFNTKKPPFDNVDVRRAFALAVDKQTLANQVLAGAVVPADRILPTGLLGTQLPIKPLAFDAAAAKDALTKAGFSNGQGLPEITLAYGQEGDNETVVQALQSLWEQNLGIKVKLQSFELATFSKNLDTTYYTPTEGLQFYYSVWGADYPDPQNFLSLLLRTDNPNNNGHFSNSDFDRLVDEADRLGDRSQIERRLQLYNQAEQIAIDEVAWLPLFYPKLNILVRPRVEGIVVTPQGLIVPDWSKLKLK